MITPSEILNEARVLLDGVVINEPRCRTIVGRAYYAAFHHALMHPAAKGFKPLENQSQHTALAYHLIKASDADVRYAGKLLQALRLRRTTADYHLSSEVRQQEAHDAYQDADRIINEHLLLE
ncbi:MAG: hypothetical protein CMM60_13590 [Rhodospirillaceae bacterium]|nr:hypothetical protein [Rhodospirillaceae bacterium]